MQPCRLKHIKHSALILLCIIFVFFSGTNIGHAYFSIKTEGNHFLKDGYKTGEKLKDKSLAVYGNLSTDTNISDENMVYLRSDNFIEMDSIPFNLFLPVKFRYHISIETKLSDLIYADLKVKKLIEEYKKVQDRSESLIWNSEHLFQVREITDSLHRRTINEKEHGSNILSNTTVLPNNGLENLNSTIQNDLKNIQTVHSVPPAYLNSINTDDRVASGREDDNNSSDQKFDVSIKANTNKNTKDSFLGRVINNIFSTIIKLISFTSENKSETAFYGIWVLMLLSFISAIFKR